jgi:hypothetical protein
VQGNAVHALSELLGAAQASITEVPNEALTADAVVSLGDRESD